MKKQRMWRGVLMMTVLLLLFAGCTALYTPPYGVSPDTQDATDAPESDLPSVPTISQKEQSNVLILMYHDVCKGALRETDNPAFCTTVEKLERDMLDLLEMGLTSLSCAQYAAGEYDPAGRYFIVTFDDGYLSNYTLAYPLLCRMGIYADIFAVTDSIGTLENHFDYAQANEMERSGYIRIYSHTCTHRSWQEEDAQEYLAEVNASFAALQTNLEAERALIFSWPNGLYSRAGAEALAEQGIVMQLVQTRPTDWSGTEAGLAYRYSVDYDTDLRAVAKAYFSGSD